MHTRVIVPRYMLSATVLCSEFLTSNPRVTLHFVNEAAKSAILSALHLQLREKREKQHASERKAASDKQLASVKQMHIDKLVSCLRAFFY